MLKLTILMDDRATHNRSLKHSHGLSILAENDGKRILFDFGADSGFIYNAGRLGVDLSALDAAVLSHGHYDHGGGFADFMNAGLPLSRLFAGKGFSFRKYSRDNMVFSNLSHGWKKEEAEDRGIVVSEIDRDTEIFPGIHLLYGFPRIHEMQNIPRRYVVERYGSIMPDDFSDEIAMAMKTESGYVLVVGCSHPGIMNIVAAAEERLGKIRGVVGGIHLAAASKEDAERAVSFMKEKGVDFLGLCHCSGCDAAELSGNTLAAGDSVFFD